MRGGMPRKTTVDQIYKAQVNRGDKPLREEAARPAAAPFSCFDALQTQRGYNLPALLMRSESAVSSQIENLTSSVRNVALAEVSGDGPRGALLIMGNLEAMKTALSIEGSFALRAPSASIASSSTATGRCLVGSYADSRFGLVGTRTACMARCMFRRPASACPA